MIITNDLITEATIGQILQVQTSDTARQNSRGTYKHEIDLSKVLVRAKTDIVGFFKGVYYDHTDRMIITAWETKTKSNGNAHYQYVAFPLEFVEDFYWNEFTGSFNDLISIYDVYMFCDCKSFRYHFSNRDNVNNILYKGGREDWKGLINYPVQGLFSVNPDKIGGICKHLLLIVGELMKTNWMEIKRGIQKIINDDIELYDILTLQDREEKKDIQRQNEVVTKEVNDIEENIYNLDQDYDKLSIKYDEILDEFNTSVNDDNLDEKAEVFISDGLDLLQKMIDKQKEAERIQKTIRNTQKKYDKGTENREAIDIVEELYNKVLSDLIDMSEELEFFMDEV